MMGWIVALFCFLAYSVFAVDPRVQLSYSTFVGIALSNDVNAWLGIPYAAPPVGNLRFAPPIDPPTKQGDIRANQEGPLCLSTQTNIPKGQSEDCLYLAVYAPSSATPKSALPVFVFIQGGGFNANANPNLVGAGLVEASGNNIIVVTFNYRVGPWGFLAGSSSAAGFPTANNGLRDQRKVFEWVQRHISAFGGDPKHVVLGGDSAGAASIALHLTAYGGRNDHYFHAAAAESVSFATVLTAAGAQYQLDGLTTALGCKDTDAAKSLACLRSKTTAEIQAQNKNQPFPGEKRKPLYMYQPVIDGDIVTDYTYTALERGKFIDVPVIFGDDTNGGTVFTPRNTASQADSNAFLAAQFPYISNAELAEIAMLYPKPNNAVDCGGKQSYCWWRQVSNAYGDIRYMCPSLFVSSTYANQSTATKRSISEDYDNYFVGGFSSRAMHARAAASNTPKFSASYAYRYNVEDAAQMAQGLGVPHTVEVSAIFGPGDVPLGSVPASYVSGGANANIVPVIQAYWTSFIRTFDPNTYKLKGAATWESYRSSKGHPQRMLFGDGGKTEMEQVSQKQLDNCAYLWKIGPDLHQLR